MKQTSRPAAYLARLLGVTGLVVWWLVATARPAAAHANLARAEPAPNAVLPQSPERVVIWFTEPVEPGFSEIQVLDTQGQAVDNGDSLVDPLDPTVLSVTLPPLPDGTYTVAWKNLSSVDGHRVRGSFIFSVGEAPAGGPAGPAGSDQPLLQSPLEPVLRWLALLAILAVVGGLGFKLWVLSSALAQAEATEAVQTLALRLNGRLLRGIWLAMGLFLIASVGHLLLQAALVQEVGLVQVVGRPLLDLVAQTEWGRLWLWRLWLFLALAVALRFFLSGEERQAGSLRSQEGSALALLLGSGVLLTISLTSHAAATEGIRLAAVVSDFFHLLAAAFWVGGLFHFALNLPLILRTLPGDERRPFLAALVPNFSALAALSVGTLIITGLYSAYAQVTVWPALQTPYGLALIAKLVLIVPLLLLGAFNLLSVSKRLAGEERAGSLLRRSVTAEATLGALVLLAVGFLVTLEPARQVASRQGLGTDNRLSFQDTAEGAHIFLDGAPGRVGPNQFQVTLHDRRGNPITNASDVSLTAVYLDADLSPLAERASHDGEGQYTFDDLFLSVAGRWQVELTIIRPDAFDAHAAFRFEVLPAAGANSAAIAPDRQTGQVLWGLELALLGFLFLGVSVPLGGWRQRRGRALVAPGVAGVIAGLLLVSGVQLGVGQETAQAGNPFPPSQLSIEEGREVYQANCLSCHGPAGRGDGPAAAALDPPPADLRTHVPLHSDQALFDFIAAGIPGTAMPSFADKLPEEERWHMVNYLRALVEE